MGRGPSHRQSCRGKGCAWEGTPPPRIRESADREEVVPGEVTESRPPGQGLAGMVRIWVFIWESSGRLWKGSNQGRGGHGAGPGHDILH